MSTIFMLGHTIVGRAPGHTEVHVIAGHGFFTDRDVAERHVESNNLLDGRGEPLQVFDIEENEDDSDSETFGPRDGEPVEHWLGRVESFVRAGSNDGSKWDRDVTEDELAEFGAPIERIVRQVAPADELDDANPLDFLICSGAPQHDLVMNEVKRRVQAS